RAARPLIYVWLRVHLSSGRLTPPLLASIKYSHSKTMIAGASIIETRSGLGAVLRRHISHPSRQPHPSSSCHPTPSQRATSLGRASQPGAAAATAAGDVVDSVFIFIL